MAEYKVMNTNEFSVYQFFKGGGQEKVREFVSGEEAVKAFHHYTNNVASRVGITERVIITDGGDCINMEWIHGKGVTFPLLQHMEDANPKLMGDLRKIVVDFHTKEDGE
jgi:hypothetical protein